jgi:hypothetical protein
VYGSESTRTDKHGNGVGRYPVETEHGRLLGITVYGNAAYATAERATLAVLDDRGELRVPPRERWLAAEFPLAETGLSPGDYVLYVADEAGPWRVLAEAGHDGVTARDVDPERVVADGPVDADVDALVAAVAGADGWVDRAEPAGELRHAAMDHPGAVADRLETLLAVLSEDATAGPAGRTDETDEADETDGTGSPTDTGNSPEDGYSGMAARCDVAWTLARAVRADPGAAGESFDELLELVAAGRDSDADHDRHLLDAFDVTGLAEPSATAARLVAGLEDDDPAVRRRTLDALYRLEHRYAAGYHPLLATGSLREAVDSLADDPDGAVREAAESVRTVHGFHLTG